MTITSAWDDLAAEMFGPEPDYDTEPTELPDADSVNRAIGRLGRIRSRATADREVAEAQIEQVRQWLEHRLASHDRAEAWHLDQLRSYHRAILASDPKRKTIALPNGTLKARAGQPAIEVTDEAAVVAWAIQNERTALVRVKTELDRKALRESVVKDGEAIPGVTVSPADVGYTVDTSLEDA